MTATTCSVPTLSGLQRAELDFDLACVKLDLAIAKFDAQMAALRGHTKAVRGALGKAR